MPQSIFITRFCIPFVTFVVNCFWSPQKIISIDIILGNKVDIRIILFTDWFWRWNTLESVFFVLFKKNSIVIVTLSKNILIFAGVITILVVLKVVVTEKHIIK